jgi:hypothetical protein
LSKSAGNLGIQDRDFDSFCCIKGNREIQKSKFLLLPTTLEPVTWLSAAAR